MYYNYFTNEVYRGASKGKTITVPAALHQIPIFIRGGSILPTRERHRRSSTLMQRDPFTLRIALDKKGNANGELYLDDGESYDHEQGNLIWRAFETERKNKVIRISSKNLATERLNQAVDGVALAEYDTQNAYAKSMESVRVEKVQVIGVGSKPTSVKLEGGADLEFEYVSGLPSGGKKEGVAGYIVVKDPRVLIKDDWAILIST